MLPPPALYATGGGGGGGGRRDACTCSTRRCALASLFSALEIWRGGAESMQVKKGVKGELKS